MKMAIVQKIKESKRELKRKVRELENQLKAMNSELKYKDEVINNYKKSVETLKEEPGRSVQAELLELRKRTTADGFIIDELNKGLENSNGLISVMEKQIDSLSLLIGVVVDKLRNGCCPITKDGYIRLHQDELRDVHTNYDVVVRESDKGFVLIGCNPKKQTVDKKTEETESDS